MNQSKKNWFLIVLTFLICGRTQALTFSADQSRYHRQERILELIGNVRIQTEDAIMSCEYARIHLGRNSAYASGQVLVIKDTERIEAEEALIDLKTGEAFFKNASLRSGNLFVEGQFFHRKSKETYLAFGAKYTTCQNCPETWSFLASDIRADIGGYAYMKNLLLRVGGIPIFWLPYLVVPLKSERQTGLLTPEFETSVLGGATLTQSFFWAINKSQDLTISLKNYELRGLKNIFEYNYMLSQNSYGELTYVSMLDRSLIGNPRFKQFNQDQSINRQMLRYRHFWELPESFDHRLELGYVSDLQYLIDFPLEAHIQGSTYLENRTSISHNVDGYHRSLQAAYFQNLIDLNPRASNQWSVHKAPELRWSFVGRRLGDWFYSWDLNWTQFSRPTIGYDNLDRGYAPPDSHLPPRRIETEPNNLDCQSFSWYLNPACRPYFDGEYHPDRDLLRTGQRLIAKTSAGQIFRLGPGAIEWQGSLQANWYRFPEVSIGDAFRGFGLLGARLFTEIVGVNSSGSLEHLVSPFVHLRTIPIFYENNHPFFGGSSRTPFSPNANISDLDLNAPWGLQFDYFDRVTERKLATFGVAQSWVEYLINPTNPQQKISKTRATWSLEQSYDFFQAQSSDPVKQPLSELISQLNLFFDGFRFYQRLIYFPYQLVTNSSSTFSFPISGDESLSIGHNQFFNLTPGKPANFANRVEDLVFDLRKRLAFLYLLTRFSYDLNEDSPTAHQFKSFGIASQMRLPGNCWYLTITHYRILGGDSITTFNFDFLWDPNQVPKIPQSFLDQIGF